MEQNEKAKKYIETDEEEKETTKEEKGRELVRDG